MDPVEQKRLEKRLVERVRAGDQPAYMELVEQYQQRLFRRACAIIGDHESAEDVLQEALLAAYRAISRFRGNSSFYTWIYRVLVNKCYDHLRQQRFIEQPFGDEEPLLKDERINLEKNLELSDVSRYLIEKVNQLDKKYRAIVMLRYFDEMSQEDIGRLLHLSLGTVKSRLFKARELIRRLIVQDGREEELLTELR